MTDRATNKMTGKTVVLLLLFLLSSPLGAQERPEVIDLTLEHMVELALSTSYRVRQLDMSIERTRENLRAEQARLKSSVDLELTVPTFNAISDYKWNSDLQRNEIVHENTRRWEAELSIQQPVILFGYPTNGYLSLNNRVYRYNQIDDEGVGDVRYYNRYYVSYRQPLFQPNNLQNALEEAELDLEDSELDFHDDVVGIVDDLSDDYFELFEDAYRGVISEGYVRNLETAEAMAIAAADSSRAMESGQVRVELANAREQVQQARSQYRLQAAGIKQRLQLPEEDSLSLEPVLDVRPVDIDVERAIDYALQITPSMRQLAIDRRRGEIRLENTRGRNSFRVDLNMSYGREMQDPQFRNLWAEPSNSYTVDVEAFIPIWDWGERDARIASSRISLEQTELRIEEARTQIVSSVRNEVRNVEEYESRAMAMEANLRLAAELSGSSLDLYRDGSITVLELLQTFRREVDTANNFLDAYLGWRRALLRVQELTYYDFERGMPVLQRFGIEVPSATSPDPLTGLGSRLP